MNAKEATRFVFRHGKKSPGNMSEAIELRLVFAKGFLEAIEKFKPLVKALEAIEKGLFSKRNADVIARQVLETYKRDVLGE